MKKKFLLFIFSLFLLNKTFAQCNTVVTPSVISFCGPGCYGDVTFNSASGTPPYDLIITGGPTVQYTSSYNWTNICPGTYPYSVTDASFSCTDTGTVIIVSNPLPGVIVSPNNPTVCLGGSVTLIATGAVFYTWAPIVNLISASIDSAVVTLNPVVTTTYTVVGYTIEGCTSSVTVTVVVNPLPTVSFNVTNESCVGCCDGSLAPVIYGTAPFACLWSNSSTSFTNTNLCSGSYSIVISDAAGCASTSTAVIGTGTCNPDFTVTPDAFTPHMYWITNNVTGAAPISYLWTWGDATSDTIPFPSHTYAQAGFYDICLSITDGAGCSSSNCWSSNLARMDAANSMISVTVVQQIPTSALDNSESDFTLYPNPAASQFTIYNSQFTIEKLEVYSILGEKIFNQQPEGQQQVGIDVSKWNNGIYFVKLKTSEGDKIQKLIVQH